MGSYAQPRNYLLNRIVGLGLVQWWIVLASLCLSTAVGKRTPRVHRDGSKCLHGSELLVLAEQAGLSANETAALEESGACVPESGVRAPYLQSTTHNGVPKGVKCKLHKWCALALLRDAAAVNKL